MLGVTDYEAFVLAFAIFLLIPGPGNLVLITSTTKGGLRAGLAATVGIILGDQVLCWLAVAGVAALLTAYPTAFQAVQWLGAAYLAWLGLKMLFAKQGAAPILNIKPYHYLRQALFITLLNPKAIVLAITLAVLALAYGVLAVLLTHFFAIRMRSNPRFGFFLEKLAGLCLLGFGARLVFSR